MSTPAKAPSRTRAIVGSVLGGLAAAGFAVSLRHASTRPWAWAAGSIVPFMFGGMWLRHGWRLVVDSREPQPRWAGAGSPWLWLGSSFVALSACAVCNALPLEADSRRTANIACMSAFAVFMTIGVVGAMQARRAGRFVEPGRGPSSSERESR